MINTSIKNLKIISAFVWIIGGVILFFKGYQHLKEAQLISYNIEMISAILVLAFVIGMIKNKYIMSPFCRKNIERINSLTEPKIYQFFEFYFLLLLILMIVVGISLSAFARGNYFSLLAVGTIDLALSTSLLKSSVLFFKEK